MIIEYNFAVDLLEKIEEELNLYESQNKIEVSFISIAKMKPNFEWLRKVQNYSLPIFSNGSTDIIQVSREYYEILVSNWEKEHPKLIQKGMEETVKSMMEDYFPEETIQIAISDKISRLIYEYDLVLEATKESNQLFGIEDEEKILLIHLNKYNEIINSNNKQIDFLRGITLNKKINDLILEIYIRFINRRLKMLNPELHIVEKKKSKKLTKILWKGTQRDLCELFVELQEKKWIEEFKYGERNKIASSICNLFDLTLTERNEESNIENSFYQILKGEYNRKTKNRDYDDVLGTKEERKFNKMKKNGH